MKPEDEVVGTRTVHIHVEEVWPRHALDDEADADGDENDNDVAGIYRAEVPADLGDSMAAACALGAFHSTFVVNWLETFVFTVRDVMTFGVLEPDEEVDWIELGKSCFDIEYLGR
jgi:hypothetical protein